MLLHGLRELRGGELMRVGDLVYRLGSFGARLGDAGIDRVLRESLNV